MQYGNMNSDSKIYVAGGTGLVGSAIIESLSSKAYTNIIATYRNRLPNESRVTNHALRFEKIDLTEQQAVAKFFKQEKLEYVFLAAGKVGGIVANNTYRADFIYENLMIQNNIIHQSYKNKVKKLLFLGSTCIYPKDAPQPMSEDCLLTDPLEYTNEPYAIAKIAGIKMCESYNLQYGTNFISVMPTNLYGPNDNFDLEKSHVLPALIRKIHLGKALENNDWETIRDDLNKLPIEGIDGKAKEEEILNILSSYGLRLTSTESRPAVQIEIWGTGKPKREFLWSEDLADACVFLMENRNFKDIIESHLTLHESRITGSSSQPTLNESRITNHEIRNTHINIGTGEDISIKELAETIKEIVGFNGELYFNIDKPDGTMKKLTDVSKLHAMGWTHSMKLKDGIQELYTWYREGEE